MNINNYLNDIFSFTKPGPGESSSAQPATEADPINDEDLYAILGCKPGSTIEQINTEYRLRARELHPDKCSSLSDQTLKTEIDRKFCRLQRAKEILGDQARRQDYDNWRQSGLALSYRKWSQLNESGGLHSSIHWFGKRDTNRALTEATGNSGNAGDPKNGTNSREIGEMSSQKGKFDFRKAQEKENPLLKQFRNYEI